MNVESKNPAGPGGQSALFPVLLATTLASFMIPFMTSSITIALPAIGSEFGIDVVMLGWVSTSFLLASASMLIPFGRLADIRGRRRMFTMGNIVLMMGCLLAALSTSGIMLIAARIVQGLGGAAIFSTAAATLLSVVPGNQRGKVLGINTAAVYLGLSLGPVIGGFMTRYIGWRSLFLFGIAGSLLVTAVTLTRVKMTDNRMEKERFDLAGSVIYTITLIATMYGFTLLPDLQSIWWLGGGAVGVLFFLRREARTEAPLIDLQMFRHNRGFTLSCVAALANYSGSWAVAFLLSLYLQYIKGLSPQSAGLVLVTSPIIQAVLSPLAGRLSDRIEPRILASLGMGLTALAIGLLALVNEVTPLGYIVACLVLVGLGFALFSSPNTNAVMSSVEHRFYGFASASLGTFRQIGMLTSMAIVMLVFATFIGRVEITPPYYPRLVSSMHVAFLICAVLCFSAIYASLARGNIHENGGQNRKS
ncbi:MAG: MFS transporter [Dehalococcoidales bacterium]|nr:MFS transporter [Dehalococcoidales bacterium]